MAVGEGVGIGDTEVVGEGVVLGLGWATGTPLLQTNFLPLLIQVYFLPR